MCGICGVAGSGSPDVLERMALSLAHRGPDDSGLLWRPEVRAGFGFRRLSILDPSPAGHQPMTIEDGLVAVMLNGEIYNFRELRADLEARGHRFRSRSDAEVLLRGYMQWGRNSLRRFNGMFAFAILDLRTKTLLLARDRLGIKPLFYHHGDGHLVFGSEIKAILASGLYRPELNRQALYDYLTYLYVPCPDTIYRGVQQLPPGHLLELSLEGGEPALQPYWNLEEAIAGSPVPGPEELREAMAEAVRRQMVSDVPLGAFLSGGTDSAIMTALMAHGTSEPIRTFTVVFKGADLGSYDESERARAVAELFGTRHSEIPVRVDPRGLVEVVEGFDEPFGNPTAHLMRLISEIARPEVTVALCGAGGDELFAGYPRYRAAMIGRRLGWAIRVLAPAARRALALASDDYRSMRLRRAREFFEGWDSDPVRRMVAWTYFLNGHRKDALLAAKAHPPLAPSERIMAAHLTDNGLEDEGNRLLAADVATFLLDNVLAYSDRMSMAVGLEVRVPYLDHELVQLAFRIPFRDKLQGRRTKVALRGAFRGLVPDAVLRGPKKGFNVPLGLWMRDHLDVYFDRYMDRRWVRDQGIFDWEQLQRLRVEHRAGRRDNSHPLFGILMFDAWYRRYLLGEPLPRLEGSGGRPVVR
jgi:asparagine synthase (glutamine-hydrolysing)